MLFVTVLCLRTFLRFCETIEDTLDELHLGRGAFDVDLAPLTYYPKFPIPVQ